MNSEVALKILCEEREQTVNGLKLHEDPWLAVACREWRTEGTPAIDKPLRIRVQVTHTFG